MQPSKKFANDVKCVLPPFTLNIPFTSFNSSGTLRYDIYRVDIHYSDVIMGAMRLKSPGSRMFTLPFVRAQIKDNIKAPRYWPLWWEFTCDRWIPSAKGQWREKCFHLMTSSCRFTKRNRTRKLLPYVIRLLHSFEISDHGLSCSCRIHIWHLSHNSRTALIPTNYERSWNDLMH